MDETLFKNIQEHISFSLKIDRTLITGPNTVIDGDSNSSSSKKVVRFATTVNRFKPRIDPPEAGSLWYNVTDYRRILRERRLDASRMAGRHLKEIDDENECFWGLEKLLFPDLAERVLDTKANVSRAVLTGQRRQCDPDMLSKASNFHSRWSAKHAREKGLIYSNGISRIKAQSC